MAPDITGTGLITFWHVPVFTGFVSLSRNCVLAVKQFFWKKIKLRKTFDFELKANFQYKKTHIFKISIT